MTTRTLAVSLALLLGALASGPSTAQQPTPRAQAAPADWDSEEEQIRAREDVADLEAWVKAKKAQVHKAKVWEALLKERQTMLDRQKSKGFISGLAHNTGDMTVAEAEADRETRSAELREVETRRDRARRRLALIDRGLSPAPLVSDSASSNSREIERMRSDIDYLKRRVRMLSVDP